jgi:hypothetical protein
MNVLLLTLEGILGRPEDVNRKFHLNRLSSTLLRAQGSSAKQDSIHKYDPKSVPIIGSENTVDLTAGMLFL